MEFLNPAALYALLLLPLLLIAYLVRRRPQRVVFSSVLLMRHLAARVSAGRSGVPPIFFLHLLILTLLLLCLGEPSLPSPAINVALVLDNSASMQAVNSGRSRFQAALDEASKTLRALPAGARSDLYVLAPSLARVGEAGLSADGALARLWRQTPLDVAERALDHGSELSRLARERGYDRLYFFTDHPAAGPSRTVRVVTVGKPQNNLAVTSFQINRSFSNAAHLKALVEVKSFSADDEKFTVSVKGGGKVVAARDYTVAAGKSVAAQFDNLPGYPFYEAEIAAPDALPLDSRRFATPPAAGLKVLAVSPRADAVATLRAIPGVELQIVSPEAYAKGDYAPHTLEIFHYAAPAAWPEAPALLILPPAENQLVRIAAGASRGAVTGWREPHPLTRYVNFSLLRPGYTRALKPGAAEESVFQTAEGALALASERKNSRYLALGFDPLPFLGRQNLPMSIFTLNALDWLSAAPMRSIATGAPLNTRIGAGEALIAPNGAKLDPAAHHVALAQGIYRVEGLDTRYLAVNFDDPGESDLRAPTPIQVRDEPGAAAERSFAALLWPYFLIAALALLLLEWFLHPFPAWRNSEAQP
jgi:Aerotolerance regulator N-terminal